ncbi:hypothetical protein [Pontiella sulfatireligans]|uniref:Phospholipase/carboxylesterase/thioesterase domain-containing protein n=1 Tax=Pontiella sulfatireligans TaxID=2750658 RepID=A0A6C2UDB3_9BACT|nr:hypothetical protein [Pontiella sulfatireligans]VGO18178.1 hypothetical protein SCARR_00229 [Pontiella sulfatireligans]
MKNLCLNIAFLTMVYMTPSLAVTNALWSHLDHADALNHHGVETEFIQKGGERVLNLTQAEEGRYAWVFIPAPVEGWGLDHANFIEAEINNSGTRAVEVILWVVPDRGWDAIGKRATIEAGKSLLFKCNLRASFKDGTPKLNPHRINKVEVMFSKAPVGASIQVKGLSSSGTVPEWVMPEGRMTVPNMETRKYAAGKRVRYQLLEHRNTDIYSVLYLPKTWTRHGKYPVIVEFPGNIYYTGSVYSSGRPEQCAIGYGMSKHEEVIWVSVPFVDYDLNENVESGFGNADDTADYTVKLVNELVDSFGGDKDNVVITGFSRGALACGYIGRRNDVIASLWKGFHPCQHYDGDGWNGADMNGAKERAKRIGKSPVFHTDNERHEALKTMLSEVGADVTFASSGLGAHATAMFLDDRPSTVQLRDWYGNLIQK